MEKVLSEYFAVTPEEKLTITGIALALGMSRQGVYDYYKRPGYKEVLDIARLKVEHSYEMALREAKNPAGPIFALKQMDWTDRQEIDQRVLSATVTLELTDERRELLAGLLRKKLPEPESGEQTHLNAEYEVKSGE